MKNLLELVFIMDRSGSMAGLESDTLGGFNSMLGKQREENQDVLVTTVFFNQTNQILHDRVPIAEIIPLTKRDYFASGSTALLDAIGDTVQRIRIIHKYAREEDIPAHTLFVIITDGMENASRRFRHDQIKKMIETQKTEKNWEFLFLGANIDTVSVGKQIGIEENRSISFFNDGEGQREIFSGMPRIISCLESMSEDNNFFDAVSDYKTIIEQKKRDKEERKRREWEQIKE